MLDIPQNSWTRSDLRRFKKSFALLPACDIAPGGTWADLGCGEGIFSGALAHLLAQKGRVLALDLARKPLIKLQQQVAPTPWGSRIYPFQADILSPLPWKQLDGLLAANALHFFRQEQKETILRQLQRCLKPGGSLIVVEYNSDHANLPVPHPMLASQWLRLLEDSGWRRVSLKARTPSSFLGEMVALQAFTQ